MPSLSHENETQLVVLRTSPNTAKSIYSDNGAVIPGADFFSAEELLRPPLVRSPVKMQHLRAEIISSVAASSLRNTFHNLAHTEDVESMGERCLQHLFGFNESNKQVFRLALSSHDDQHCGYRYRQRLEPREHAQLSNEELAVLKGWERLQDHLSPSEFLQFRGLILSTSFKQSAADFGSEGQDLARPYRPQSKLEHLMVFVDLANFYQGAESDSLAKTLVKFMNGGIRLIAEGGFEGQHLSFSAFIEAQRNFLRKILIPKLDDVLDIFDSAFATQLRVDFQNLSQAMDNLSHSVGTTLFKSIEESFHREWIEYVNRTKPT